MIDVFGFLIIRSMVNRFTRRLTRLKEPRYLVPFLFGILWFASAIFRPFSHGKGRVLLFSIFKFPPDTMQALTFLAGVVIFAWVALLWVVPSKTAELAFSPAEIHFLFTAPLSRRQIVQYKIGRAQFGIFIGALIGAIVFGARLNSLGGWARVLAFWLFFAIGYLHGIAASFVRTDLMESGWSGLRRRAVTVVVVLAIVGAVVVSARQSWGDIANALAGVIGPDGEPSMKQLGVLTHALAVAGTTGLAGKILWPFLVLPRLLFAQNSTEFLRMGGIGLAILVAHYFWVMQTDASFEEASVEASQRTAEKKAARLDTMRTGGILVKKARAFPWRLKPTGRPAIALVWKNLVNLTRVTPIRALIGVSAFLFGMVTWSFQIAQARSNLWLTAAIIAALMAAIMSVFGPGFVRNDLREDLFRIDVIRTFPLAGHAVVMAEVLGSWIVLAVIQLLTLLFSGLAFVISGAKGAAGMSAPWAMGALVGAVIVLPAFTLVAVALQNGLVVLFPAWVQLGNSRTRGFEVSGQRILTMLGTSISLAVVALPAVVLGGLLAWPLARPLGPLCLLPGGVVSAAVMVLEVFVACRLLGKLLDRLDPSTAGIEAQEA